MSSNDPRYVVGGLVHAKACHVTNESECRRRYGSHAKTKLVNGVVTKVDTIRNGNNKRTATEITVYYNLGGSCRKVQKLNSRRVKAGHVAAINSSDSNGPVIELVNENRETLQSTNDGGTAPVVGISTDEMLAELESSDKEVLERAADEAAGAAGVATIQQEEEGVRPSPRRRGMTRAAGPPVADVHGIEWFQADPRDTALNLNGNVPMRQWSIRTPVGDILIPGRNQATTRDMTPVDYFLLMFPPKQLQTMLQHTNAVLDTNSLQKTNISEMLKWFGVIILTTKFEFASRRSLWNTVSASKYRPAPQFGLTGMSKHRFEELFKCVRWSHQPPAEGGEECSETHRWKLVDDFVTNFNKHQANYFNPSDCICVDESMSRWYRQGGRWINHGLPQYIAIDRKPENGCEIQNAACGRSGVMLQLKLVKGVDLVDENDDGAPTETSLLHGTSVLLKVVSPWFGSHRVVCADSYFASVGAAKELFKNGLRFIGVVKTATKGFPKKYLSGIELQDRGDFVALTAMPADEGDLELASFVWMDRERRYFIATAGSFEHGTPYTRVRWRQLIDKPNAPPEKVNLVIEQPKIAEIYYSTCSAIDKHNRLRQDDLRIEKKIETINWSTRVNLSIFAMIVVDSWLVYNAFANRGKGEELNQAVNQKEFYSVLAEELIDNTYHEKGRAARRSFQEEACIQAVESGSPKAGVLTHLTPIKRFKNNMHGQKLSHRYQGRCKVCSKKTTWQCSDCEDNGKAVFLCPTKNGKRCFVEHISHVHTHLEEYER